MLRTAIARQARLFTTSARLGKGPVEVGKDALKTVDRTVSDVAVKGIETGEAVAGSIKETVHKATGGDVKGKANEMAGQAKGKASELSGQAKGKASELEGKAKAGMQ